MEDRHVGDRRRVGEQWMTPDKWLAISVSLVVMLVVIAAAAPLVRRFARLGRAEGWMTLLAILLAYMALVVLFAGARNVDVPIVVGAKHGLLGLAMFVVWLRFWKPRTASAG
jgi:hypothetical protein